MNRIRSARVALLWMVFVLGSSVFVAHVFDAKMILTIMPGMVSMKTATALAFSATALAILHKDRDVALFALVIIGLSLTGYLKDTTEHFTVGAGVPSLGTAVGFVLSYTFIKNAQWRVAVSLFTISLAAVAGYLGNVPLMYYYFPGISTAMALHTAMGFMALSVAMMLEIWIRKR